MNLTPQGTSPLDSNLTLRPLVPDDLEQVVALDRPSAGPSRRGYFQKRLDAALRTPRGHLQFALASERGLLGFLLARRAGGEYGGPDEVVVLEAVGVDSSARNRGYGQQLVGELVRWMRGHEIRTLMTQVDWRNHSMLKFLASAKFTLAPRLILDRKVERLPLPDDDADIEATPHLVRTLRASDFDAIVRLDRRITGKDRSAYVTRKFDEVLTESAIEVSLVAESEGFVVGFAMARVDFGDFGHVDASASLDTLGVDPRFAHQGYGRAVLSQMIENLGALHVERLETEVQSDNLALLHFLYDLDFGPSQRLSFRRTV